MTAKLLRAAGSERPMLSYHDHSSRATEDEILARAVRESVVLVSDAGTPLISDPGHELVARARARGLAVTTAPGASAAIAALSISGLPGNRFLFVGFLPAKAVARDRDIAALAAIPATLIFYESALRLPATLKALLAGLGDRDAAIVRELTKLHEEYHPGTLSELAASPGTLKGEIVILVAPPAADVAPEAALDGALRAALRSLPPGRAAASVAAALGVPRAVAYARALELGRE